MTTSAVLPSATSIKKEEDMGIAVSLRQEERSKDNRDTSIVLSFIWIFFILLLFVHTLKDMQGILEIPDIQFAATHI